jgi:hypothetical protein
LVPALGAFFGSNHDSDDDGTVGNWFRRYPKCTVCEIIQKFVEYPRISWIKHTPKTQCLVHTVPLAIMTDQTEVVEQRGISIKCSI